jgi:hypothetical protein
MLPASRYLVVFTVTEESDGAGATSSGALTRLFDSSVLTSPFVCHIHCNPIAATALSKCVKAIGKAEHLRLSAAAYAALVAASRGDVRNALNCLQFDAVSEAAAAASTSRRSLKASPPPKGCKGAKARAAAKRAEKAAADATADDGDVDAAAPRFRGRDEAYSVFRSLGKILYAKRGVAPETIVDRAAVPPLVFVDFLHQNYVEHVPTCGDAPTTAPAAAVATATTTITTADVTGNATTNVNANADAATATSVVNAVTTAAQTPTSAVTIASSVSSAQIDDFDAVFGAGDDLFSFDCGNAVDTAAATAAAAAEMATIRRLAAVAAGLSDADVLAGGARRRYGNATSAVPESVAASVACRAFLLAQPPLADSDSDDDSDIDDDDNDDNNDGAGMTSGLMATAKSRKKKSKPKTKKKKKTLAAQKAKDKARRAALGVANRGLRPLRGPQGGRVFRAAASRRAAVNAMMCTPPLRRIFPAGAAGAAGSASLAAAALHTDLLPFAAIIAHDSTSSQAPLPSASSSSSSSSSSSMSSSAPRMRSDSAFALLPTAVRDTLRQLNTYSSKHASAPPLPSDSHLFQGSFGASSSSSSSSAVWRRGGGGVVDGVSDEVLAEQAATSAAVLVDDDIVDDGKDDW